MSNLRALSQVFERLVTDQIALHLCSKNLPGCKPDHSCNTAILKVLQDIRPEYVKG